MRNSATIHLFPHLFRPSFKLYAWPLFFTSLIIYGPPPAQTLELLFKQFLGLLEVFFIAYLFLPIIIFVFPLSTHLFQFIYPSIYLSVYIKEHYPVRGEPERAGVRPPAQPGP